MFSKGDKERLTSVEQALISAARELDALLMADSRLLAKICRHLADKVADLNRYLQRLQSLSDGEMDTWLQVLDRAEVVLGSEENAVCWFSNYSPALGGVPMYVITWAGGVELVLNQLGRMEQTVYT